MSIITNSNDEPIKQVVILIPIYSNKMTICEIISLKKAIEVFNSQTIIFVAPEGLDVAKYNEIIYMQHKDYSFKYFSTTFFDGIVGYNRLMLSIDFYECFVEYKYMLIYQLDAYVFNDQLSYWCELEYDYIGAPWIVNTENKLEIEKFAGNGGFSLRKVSSFINVLKAKNKIVLNPIQLLSEYSQMGIVQFFRKIPLIIVRFFGYRNNTNFYIESNKKKEDVFWAFYAPMIDENFISIKGFNAIPFAFDRFPSYLYNLNENRLPFGCHAWNKNEKEFWKRFIQI